MKTGPQPSTAGVNAGGLTLTDLGHAHAADSRCATVLATQDDCLDTLM